MFKMIRSTFVSFPARRSRTAQVRTVSAPYRPHVQLHHMNKFYFLFLCTLVPRPTLRCCLSVLSRVVSQHSQLFFPSLWFTMSWQPAEIQSQQMIHFNFNNLYHNKWCTIKLGGLLVVAFYGLGPIPFSTEPQSAESTRRVYGIASRGNHHWSKDTKMVPHIQRSTEGMWKVAEGWFFRSIVHWTVLVPLQPPRCSASRPQRSRCSRIG